MKYCIYFCLTLSFISNITVYAETKNFKISGQILNGTPPKNVCLLSQSSTFLGKAEIVNGKFEFFGTYEAAESPYFKIILTDRDSLNRKDLAEDRSLAKQLCKVYYEPFVRLNYDMKTGIWSADGTTENELYKAFLKNQSKYDSKIDSAYGIVEKEDISEALKEEKKRKIKLTTLSLQRLEDVKLIEAYPNSIVSLGEFWSYPFMHYLPADECRRIYNEFADSLKNTPFGRRLEKRIIDYEVNAKPIYPTPPKLNIGDVMYSFTLKAEKDNLVKSTDIYKDYTLIDFWATWCIPCREEIPNLKRVASKFAEKGFRIIAISTDKAEDAEKWKAAVLVEEMDAFVNLHNPYGTDGIAKELNIHGIPANYLVDKNGKVVGVNLRGKELLQILEKRYK